LCGKRARKICKDSVSDCSREDCEHPSDAKKCKKTCGLCGKKKKKNERVVKARARKERMTKERLAKARARKERMTKAVRRRRVAYRRRRSVRRRRRAAKLCKDSFSDCSSEDCDHPSDAKKCKKTCGLCGRKKKNGGKQAEQKNGKVAEWLRSTNIFRCMHGVPPVSWSKAVAASAQAWANRGLFRHARSYKIPPPAGPAGENLAVGHPTPSHANQGWYDEVRDCFRFPGCKGDHGNRGKDGNAIGHFTAMIWKGVKTIGCGQSLVKSGRWKGRMLTVCRYRAGSRLSCNTPNMRGCYRKNVPKPIRSMKQCIKMFPKKKAGKKKAGKKKAGKKKAGKKKAVTKNAEKKKKAAAVKEKAAKRLKAVERKVKAQTKEKAAKVKEAKAKEQASKIKGKEVKTKQLRAAEKEVKAKVAKVKEGKVKEQAAKRKAAEKRMKVKAAKVREANAKERAAKKTKEMEVKKAKAAEKKMKAKDAKAKEAKAKQWAEKENKAAEKAGKAKTAAEKAMKKAKGEKPKKAGEAKEKTAGKKEKAAKAKAKEAKAKNAKAKAKEAKAKKATKGHPRAPLTHGIIVAFKGGRSRRWCADEGWRVLCNRRWIRGWEKFHIWSSGGKVALRGGRHRKWCADEINRIRCNRSWIKGWEKFVAIRRGHSVALRGGHRNKYCADDRYGVRCNRPWIKGWEKFYVHKFSMAHERRGKAAHRERVGKHNERAGKAKLKGVKHYGRDCWRGCDREQGQCAWCGTGLCCRFGWRPGEGCKRTDGIRGKGHVCVPKPKGWVAPKGGYGNGYGDLS